jgi:hypothetical protein
MPLSFGGVDMGKTRRFAPDALAARVYNSGAPGNSPRLRASF